ncbi:hypothetical protein [Catellatospora sichuanensis]|uniref:hypothetical protein n=1 Tax=Catellatospora sichuanensis TaxID=1969805 RepID=UPI001182AE88|nr:hypothetical protein [Catellatospora sichuanensis]
MTINGFKDRLGQALAQADAQRVPAAASTPAAVKRRRVTRPAVIAGAAVALVLAGGATATAMGVFTKQPPLGAADTFTPGQIDWIKGSGCRPGSTVTAFIDDVAVGTAVTESAPEGPDRLLLGVYRLRFTVPADIGAGQHTLRTVCPSIEDGSQYSHPNPSR